MMDVVPSVASGAFTAPLCGHKRKLEPIEAENAKKVRANEYNIDNGLYGRTHRCYYADMSCRVRQFR